MKHYHRYLKALHTVSLPFVRWPSPASRHQAAWL